MKSVKFLAVAALLAVSTSAFAQVTGRTASASSSEGWSTIFVEYNPVSYNVDVAGADDESMTAFSLGYSQAFPVSPGTPLFVEAGLAVQYAFKSDFRDLDDVDFNMFSAKVPVNLAYKFDLNNSSVSIIPFVGATARYNISGKITDGRGKKDKDYDLFDKKDMDACGLTYDDKAFNRLQMGWQIGAKAKIGSNFLVGLSYGSDFSEISKKVKVSTTAITLGYTF